MDSSSKTFAGQSGVRNNIRGPGFFNIDSGLYKIFTMPYSEHHQIQIRWETYNVTNSVRFSGPSLTDTSSTTFGKFAKHAHPAAADAVRRPLHLVAHSAIGLPACRRAAGAGFSSAAVALKP